MKIVLQVNYDEELRKEKRPRLKFSQFVLQGLLCIPT